VATSYGQFCQFSIAPVVYTAQQSISILTDQSTDFNIEIRPCLIKAWQLANQQLACPVGYETIPGIAGCYSLYQATKVNFTKSNAEYECSLTGGSLLAIETQQKLTAIKAWLTNTKKAVNNNYWLNTATQRNSSDPFSLTWTWVWLSSQTNTYQMFNYSNWGNNQSTNFNGDSIYLNTTDLKFYVGAGNTLYLKNTGSICEAKLNTLATSQISISLTQKNQAYTLGRQQLTQFSHDVNITLSGTIDKNLVKTPSYSTIQSSLLECSKQTLDPTNTIIFKAAQTYSVNICGNYLDETRLQMFSQAIYRAWVEIHPEYLSCIQLNDCFKVNILYTRTQALDSINAVKQIGYVVLINGVVIDPSLPTSYPPNGAILKKYIELIPSRNNMNYLVCGVGATESLVASLPIEASFFNVILNKYIFDKSQGLIETVKLLIKTALVETNPLFSTNSVSILLNNRYEEVVVQSSTVNPNQVTENLPIRSSFQIFLNTTLLSQATQTLFDVTSFYSALQRRIDATPTMTSLGLKVLNSNQIAYFKPLDLIQLRMTSRLSFSDVTVLPDVYTSFIQTNKIEFSLCLKCWNDTANKVKVQLVRVETLVDSQSTRYYQYRFAVLIREPYTGLEMAVRLASETDFNQKMTAGKAQLENTINTEISLFNFNTTNRVVTLPQDALRG